MLNIGTASVSLPFDPPGCCEDSSDFDHRFRSPVHPGTSWWIAFQSRYQRSIRPISSSVVKRKKGQNKLHTRAWNYYSRAGKMSCFWNNRGHQRNVFVVDTHITFRGKLHLLLWIATAHCDVSFGACCRYRMDSPGACDSIRKRSLTRAFIRIDK